MNIFLVTYFFGNEIVDHVAWKRHCAITKKYVFEFRVISTIYHGLSNDYRWKFSFIHHLLRLMMSFSFSSKTFRHSGSAFFGEMCQLKRISEQTDNLSCHSSHLLCLFKRFNRHERPMLSQSELRCLEICVDNLARTMAHLTKKSASVMTESFSKKENDIINRNKWWINENLHQ